jgi:hypothetical protein
MIRDSVTMDFRNFCFFGMGTAVPASTIELGRPIMKQIQLKRCRSESR